MFHFKFQTQLKKDDGSEFNLTTEGTAGNVDDVLHKIPDSFQPEHIVEFHLDITKQKENQNG